MTFLADLSQRKLVQWALAYVAAAFAVLAGLRPRRAAFRLAGGGRADPDRTRHSSASS
jgi:hypothetical protein